MRAIILAVKGSRLKPYTALIPKAWFLLVEKHQL